MGAEPPDHCGPPASGQGVSCCIVVSLLLHCCYAPHMSNAPRRVGRPLLADVSEIIGAVSGGGGEWVKIEGCTTGEARSIKRQLERVGMKVSISGCRTSTPVVYVKEKR